MRTLLAVLLLTSALCLCGCSGAEEGTTSQAANELRKDVPPPKGNELPVDEGANVFGRTPLNSGGGTTGK